MRAFAARGRGDVQACLESSEAALRACELSHNQRELAFTHLSLAGCYHELGAPELALPLFRRGVAIAERIGATTITPLLQFSLALSELELGMHAEAAASARRGLDSGVGNDPVSRGLSRWALGMVALETHDLATAERELDAAAEVLDQYADWHAIAIASRARLHLACGEIAQARQLASHAATIVRPQDGFQDGEAFVRRVELDALEAAGDGAALREAAGVAIARLEQRAARLIEPWRGRWLAKPDHVATLARR
jgi:tetratricopeptide (TPR) repeat protein